MIVLNWKVLQILVKWEKKEPKEIRNGKVR